MATTQPATEETPVSLPRRAKHTSSPHSMGSRLRRMRPYQWANLLLIAGYLAVGMLGITTSNLGSVWNRQHTPGPYPDMIGPAQDLRSDEFWVGTPLALWYNLGINDVQVARMAAPSGWALGLPSGVAQAIALWDKAVLSLGGWVQVETSFALQWWLPSFLLVLLLPSLFAQLGARRRHGYIAAAVMLVSPAQIWWSMQPSGILGPTVAGCVAMFAAYKRFARRQWYFAIPQALLGGVLLANVTSRYPIWVLLLTGPVLVAVVGRIFVDRGRHLWAKLLAVGITGFTSLGLALLAMRESSEGLQALADTVYPAARRTGATALQFFTVFGAPVLRGVVDIRLPGTNMSELSSSFNVLLIVVLLVLPTQKMLWKNWRRHLPVWILAAVGAFELGWGTLTLGYLGEKIPLLNMIPPERAIQVAGFVGVILLFLLLSSLDNLGHPTVGMIAVVAAWLTVYAGSLMKSVFTPTLSTYVIWAAAAGTGVAIYILLKWPQRVWSLLVATALAATTTVGTFPVQIGLGDFRNSGVAKLLLSEGSQARDSGSVWVSDQLSFDAVMVATGVPSLSGLHRAGPDRAQWAKLDPTGKWEDSWNRGAGYVRFTLADNTKLEIGDNGFDVVEVTVDPCRLSAVFPNLTHVVSRVRFENRCLRPTERLSWARESLILYEVVRN